MNAIAGGGGPVAAEAAVRSAEYAAKAAALDRDVNDATGGTAQPHWASPRLGSHGAYAYLLTRAGVTGAREGDRHVTMPRELPAAIARKRAKEWAAASLQAKQAHLASAIRAELELLGSPAHAHGANHGLPHGNNAIDSQGAAHTATPPPLTAASHAGAAELEPGSLDELAHILALELSQSPAFPVLDPTQVNTSASDEGVSHGADVCWLRTVANTMQQLEQDDVSEAKPGTLPLGTKSALSYRAQAGTGSLNGAPVTMIAPVERRGLREQGFLQAVTGTGNVSATTAATMLRTSTTGTGRGAGSSWTVLSRTRGLHEKHGHGGHADAEGTGVITAGSVGPLGKATLVGFRCQLRRLEELLALNELL